MKRDFLSVCLYKFRRRREIVWKSEGIKHERCYWLYSKNLRHHEATTLPVSSRMFLTAEEKHLKINREKGVEKQLWKFFSLRKHTSSCRSVNKNVTNQRKDEDEEQTVTDETSWILLGMPTTTAYKTMMTEYRNCREWVMAGD